MLHKKRNRFFLTKYLRFLFFFKKGFYLSNIKTIKVLEKIFTTNSKNIKIFSIFPTEFNFKKKILMFI